MAALFFDIDGTLWDIKNIIPESTKEAIRLLKENGHKVFICSGRTKCFVQNEDLLALGFDGILYGCGTHLVYHGEDLLYKRLDAALNRKAMDIFYEGDMAVVAEGRELLYMDPDLIGRDNYGQYLLRVMKDYTAPVRENVESMEISKYTVVITDRDYQKAIDALSDEFDFMVHGSHVMEAVPKGYSKATALAVVCEKLGIDRADTYSFGDSANDIDMIKYAGTGIVMGNGTDEVKAYADYVTDDLHSDGIYNACKHFGLI